MSITAQMVKELRVKSSAGMMDCKKALSETNGDMEAAIDWLRKKGLSSASKKSGRIASEGLVGIQINNQEASIVEVNSETDFVARNTEFQSFVKDICSLSIESSEDIQLLLEKKYPQSVVSDHTIRLWKTLLGERNLLMNCLRLPSDLLRAAKFIPPNLLDGRPVDVNGLYSL